MDSIEITINRTGAATTLAARHLARRNSRVATICGAGVQGRIQAQARSPRPPGSTRSMSGISGPMRPRHLAREIAPGAEARCPASADLAVTRQSDIIVTCTSSRHGLPDARAGAARHLHRRGRRRQFRQVRRSPPRSMRQVARSSIRSSSAAEIGDLHHALKAKPLRPEHIHATLAEMLAGQSPGAAMTTRSRCSTAAALACRTSPRPQPSTDARSPVVPARAFR